jgi:hypothetical protein
LNHCAISPPSRYVARECRSGKLIRYDHRSLVPLISLLDEGANLFMVADKAEKKVAFFNQKQDAQTKAGMLVWPAKGRV